MLIKDKVIQQLLTIDREAVFVIDEINQKKYKYKDILEHCISISRCLARFETEEVLVCLDNGIELFLLYFAAILSNKTIIPVDPQKSIDEIGRICELHPHARLVSDTPIKNNKIIQPAQIFNYCSQCKSKWGDFNYFDTIDFQKTYLITYTSGSTGSPKGVKHCLNSLFYSAFDFNELMDFNEKSIVAHVMPMTYMAGILNTILLPLIAKSKIVLLPRFNIGEAAQFWGQVQMYKINTFWLSPVMLKLLYTLDPKGKAGEYLSSGEMKFCIGTAPLSQNTKRQFEERYQVCLFESYGLSETLFIASNHADSFGPKQSSGEILHNVELKIMEDGEILLKTPWMFLGYTNDHTENYFQEGYYKTGDLGYMENNLLYITGRKKELIIKGGMNINPHDIQLKILETNLVRDCCVAGVTLEEEKIVCWYVGDKTEEELKKNINLHIETTLGPIYKVDIFKKADNLPRNLNGKLDKLKLIREFRGNE